MAGIVIAVAIGLSLVVASVTCLIARRKNSPGKQRSHRWQNQSIAGPEHIPLEGRTHDGPTSRSMHVETGSDSKYEKYLPPPADDRAVQQRVKSTLDQIELYIENYYQPNQNVSSNCSSPDLTPFDSPYLLDSMAVMLSRSQDVTLLIKHALSYRIICAIDTNAPPKTSLLPDIYTALLRPLTCNKSTSPVKPGK